MSQYDTRICGNLVSQTERYNSPRLLKYCEEVLTGEELSLHASLNHGVQTMYCHAVAKRVMASEKKQVLKHLLDKHSSPVDHTHYVRVERKEWMPLEWYFLGEKLGRPPTEEDKAEYIMQKRSPSEFFRYYYFLRYPHMIQLTAEPHFPDNSRN